MGTVKEINSELEFTKALEGPSLVIVNFKAEWCPPCKRLVPIFAEMAKKYSAATFLSIDIDECGDLATPFGIFVLPTFILFRDQEIVDTHMGSDSHILEAIIKKHYKQGRKGQSIQSSTPSLGSIDSTASSGHRTLIKLESSTSQEQATSEKRPNGASCQLSTRSVSPTSVGQPCAAVPESSVGQSSAPERASLNARSKKSKEPSLSLPEPTGPSEQEEKPPDTTEKEPPNRHSSRRSSRDKKTNDPN